MSAQKPVLSDEAIRRNIEECGPLRSVERFAPLSVRDMGARGDGLDDTEAIQKAIRTGCRVTFPRGCYGYTRLFFDQNEQTVEFEPGAVLRPIGPERKFTPGDHSALDEDEPAIKNRHQVVKRKEPCEAEYSKPVERGEAGRFNFVRSVNSVMEDASLAELRDSGEVDSTQGPPQGWSLADGGRVLDSEIVVSGHRQVFRNLTISTHEPARRFLRITGSDCSFYDTKIEATKALEFIRLDDCIRPRFSGGKLSGAWVHGSVGLHFTGKSNMARIEGMTIRATDVGVAFSGVGHDDPLISGGIIDGTPTAAILVEPRLVGVEQARVSNLNLVGCHLEGAVDAILIRCGSTIVGANIQGCAIARQSRRPSRSVITTFGKLEGIVLTGCSMNVGPIVDDYRSSSRSEVQQAAYLKLLQSFAIWRILSDEVVNCADLFNHWAKLDPEDAEMREFFAKNSDRSAGQRHNIVRHCAYRGKDYTVSRAPKVVPIP